MENEHQGGKGLPQDTAVKRKWLGRGSAQDQRFKGVSKLYICGGCDSSKTTWGVEKTWHHQGYRLWGVLNCW